VVASTSIAAVLAGLSETPASLAAWRRVTAVLDGASDDALTRDLQLVADACAGWPDAVRRAPGRWLRDRMDGRPQPRLHVARAIDLSLFGDTAGDRLAWADAPELAAATILRIFDDRFDDAGLARWLGSPNNPHPVELALGANLGDRGVQRLVTDPRVSGLRSLALYRNVLGPAGIAALLDASMPYLRRLVLARDAIDLLGAEALAGPTTLAQLELLDLHGNRLDGPAVRALTRAPLLAGLRSLNLSHNAIGAEGCAALAACPHLAELDVLYLHDCDLDDDAVAGLLRAPWLSHLSCLALSANLLTSASVTRLVDHRALALRELDVCQNAFDSQAAEERLRAAPPLAGLRRLCV
jgi:hypothetical protein